MTSDPAWFQTGVFYEVAVHSFQDSTGDGFGDLAGLTSRLDHLASLGITAIWMLPVMPSPMRDGGYDVTDMTGIRADYGTVEDMSTLISEAHGRGIRVIIDFVVNHTSDQHPWFTSALDPGSDKHDWYVWSDSAEKYLDARVIFTDTHDSNWTWNERAGAYYWHRFFDHQPDLNFENAGVRAAVEDSIRFWLDLGIDGLRLDAVPYLFEKEGTNCENLPATHSYLKELRAIVDNEYPEAILLAEANQWPNDLLPYFGNGDECHMAFHFPLMPRMFLALAQQDVTPITWAMEQTPALPEGTAWAMFLRNHDELTLEMVDQQERDVLNATYAPDPAMRKNIGIRRRLAPLLGGDRRKIELMNAVLFAMPGTPVIYYGDEIGMGDEYLLDDRDGVRTPMQWDATATAGWSDADPDDFYLPVVQMGGYAPTQVNAENQATDPDSLLTFMKSIIEKRRSTPDLSHAPYEPLASGDTRVLAFARGAVTVIANFSDEDVQTPWGPLEPFGWRWLGA
ncbi:MAG: maltose alpha-D-glucosyltransferase [Acidimicrobiia bacterium]